VHLDFTYKIPYSLKELKERMDLAFSIFKKKHSNNYKFARAIFGSWYCSIGDCKFCFLSTQKKAKIYVSKRRVESVIAESIILKHLNVKLQDFTGGVLGNDYSELVKLTKLLYYIFEEPVWINLNVVPLKVWDEIKKYVEGLIYSTETFNKKLHDFVAPSKPLENSFKVFEFLDSEKKKKGVTLIIGLGETWKDIEVTNEFLETWQVNHINVYGLKPIKGTIYENKVSPPLPYILFWISELRINNPDLIVVGSKSYRYINEYPFFYKAGANYYSKLRFINDFGKKGFKYFDYLNKKFNIPHDTIVSMNEEEFNIFKEKVLSYNLDNLIKKSRVEFNKELVIEKIKNYLKIMEKNILKSL
jgi:biotin synthase-like enzyme